MRRIANSQIVRRLCSYAPPPTSARLPRGWEPSEVTWETTKEPRALTVSLCGAPNAGKTSLLNALVGQKVGAVSTKRNTTRDRCLGVYSDRSHNVQLVFLDTPGVPPDAMSRRGVEVSFATAAESAMEEADAAVVVVDVARRLTEDDVALHTSWLRRCAAESMAVFLVLNKADLVSSRSADRRETSRRKRTQPKLSGSVLVRERATFITDAFETAAFEAGALDAKGFDALPGPPRVHLVSALQNEGIAELRAALATFAIPRPWEFRSDVVTDLSDLARVEEVIREKLFRNLHQNVPYTMKQENRSYNDVGDGSLVIHQDIHAPSRAIVNMLTGRSGATLRAIARASEAELSTILKRRVRLHLHVSLKKPLH